MSIEKKTTLVLGATGKTGRRVVDRLKAREVPTRIGSRNSETPFDWKDRSTWKAAVKDVDSVYVSYYPDLAATGAVEDVRAFAAVAKEAGVKHLVLLSGRGEEEAQAAEAVVQKCGIDWTIVRCSWFNQNFSENYFLDPILAGELALPAGDVGEPFVDADDIADVAVAALTDKKHIGQLYELTGPRLITFAQAVAEIAKATGREIRYVQIPFEDYMSGVASFGLPKELVNLIAYLFREVLDGRNAYLADGVQRALGRAPRDFGDYVRESAAAGTWNR